MDADAAHIQASFFCEDARYSIPDSKFSIPVTATRVDLNQLIQQLTCSASSPDSSPIKHEFDFLIQDRLIRGTLEDHVTQHRVSTEKAIPIQCIERNPPPSLSQEIDHKDWVSAVHCCGKLILTGCYDNCVRVWSMNGKLVCVAEGHSGPVKDVRWISACDDQYLFLSGSHDQAIYLWRLTIETDDECDLKGHVTLIHQCKGHARSVEAMDISPDKSKFCSVGWDKHMKIWSAVPDSIPLDEVEQESDLLPTKRRKTGSKDRCTTRTPLVTLQGHTKAVTAVVWGSTREGEEFENTVVTAGWDCTIRMWDVTTGMNTTTLNGSKAFHCIDWNGKTNLIASGNSDKLVRLWDARQSESSIIQSSLSSHSGWVMGVKWSPVDPHRLLTGSYDSTLRLWDTRSTKKPLFSVAAHEGKVLCCDWSDPKVFASGGTDNKLRTYTCSI